LSRALPPRRPRLALLGMAHHRQQPPGAVLRAHRSGPRPAGGRARPVGAALPWRQPRAAERLTGQGGSTMDWRTVKARLLGSADRDSVESEMREEMQF